MCLHLSVGVVEWGMSKTTVLMALCGFLVACSGSPHPTTDYDAGGPVGAPSGAAGVGPGTGDPAPTDSGSEASLADGSVSDEDSGVPPCALGPCIADPQDFADGDGDGDDCLDTDGDGVPVECWRQDGGM